MSKEKKEVKNILFRGLIKGKGIVNYDGNSQKTIYYGEENINRSFKTINDNVSFAKKHFTRDEDGNLKWKVSISSNCLRHGIFNKQVPFQTNNISHDKYSLCSFLASPTCLLRGYTIMTKKESYVRTGPLKITDAEQICNAESVIETMSKTGEKVTSEDTKDNSFYSKETVGDIEYKFDGSLDLCQLQFISFDQVFGRYGMNPDMFDIYKGFLKAKIENFDGELGYYKLKTSEVDIPEYGLKLNDETMNFLIQTLFENIVKLNITRAGAFAKLVDFEYKLVYDELEDTLYNEDGWTSISSKKDIENISLNIKDYYIEEDLDVSKKKRLDIENSLKEAIQDKKDKKAKAADDKKKAKSKAVTKKS